MQKLIAFLLHKFTPFRVVAWAGGNIAGIGVSNHAITRNGFMVK